MAVELIGERPDYSRALFENVQRLWDRMKRRPEEAVTTEELLSGSEGEIIQPRDPRMPYGGRLIHFQGKAREYEVEHYTGPSYKFHEPLLRGIITNLNTSIFRMDPAQSRNEVKKNMDASGANVMLFRPAGSDNFVGFAILRRMKIAGHRVLYVAERAIVEEHQRQHLGRFVISEALRYYRQDRHEPIEVIANKTQSAAAVLSIIESGEVVKLAPFQKKFSADPELQKILIGFYRSTRNHSSIGLNRNTGVSSMEYSEGENVAYHPDPDHQNLMKIHNMMERILKINRYEGDAVNCLGWTRPHMDAVLDPAA